MAGVAELRCFMRILSSCRRFGNDRRVHLFQRNGLPVCGCRSHASSSAIPSHLPSTSRPAPPTIGNAGDSKAQKISQAMKAYLERAQAHDEFMQAEIAEYEIGKRHLANIMGVDADNFGQQEIDAALEYLLPSGLFDKKARPQMKHPTEVIPKRKAAQFGMDGRPFHAMFYTGIPNYFQLMHDVAVKVEALKTHEDNVTSGRIKPSEDQKLSLAGSVWIEKKLIEQQLNEKMSDAQYENFKNIMERLADQSYSKHEETFIMSYRRLLVTRSIIEDIKPLQHDELGRAYAEGKGRRKQARCHVKVWAKGTGNVSINGKDLLGYFPQIIDREQVMFPLQFTDKLGEVDFEATVESGGESGQAGALRAALSVALCSIVNRDVVEKMRLAGLLTIDPRVTERQKAGQAGARKKFTWKKR